MFNYIKTSKLFLLACLLTTTFPVTVIADTTNIDQRLQRIEQLLENQGLLDMLQQLQQLQQQLNQLRGEIEQQNYSMDQLRKRQRDLYADIDQRLQKMERGNLPARVDNTENNVISLGGPPLQTLSPVDNLPEAPPGAQPAESSLTFETMEANEPEATLTTNESVAIETTNPETTSQDAVMVPQETTTIDPVQVQAEYQQAFKLLKQSLYDQAIRSFQTFLANYPNSDYSDNAQYWLAEAYYVMRQFEPALAEYQKLVADYPNSQKLTHAMLKVGYTLQELGQLEEAKAQLTTLIQSYPGTTAARLADERLKKINADAQQATNPVSN